MESATYKSRLHAPPHAVFAWHERRGAFQRLAPPWLEPVVERHDGIRDGDRSVLRLRLGPVGVKWVTEHREYTAGEQFRAVQVKGPFRSWSHVHHVYPASGAEGFSHVEDRVEYAPPLGALGRHLATEAIRRAVDRIFAYRHRIIGADAAAVHRFDDGRRLRIAVSGGSGTIGTALIPFLEAAGHEVLRIVRTPPKHPSEIHWDRYENRLDADKLEGLDAVIHLASEDALTMRWSEQKKMQIFANRVRSTEMIARTLVGLERPPATFICASDAGYYGTRGDEVLTERSSPGEKGFLMAVCQELENAADRAAEAGIRTVRLRTGLVVTPAAGLLRKLLPPFQLGLGGTYGDPDQYVSWIGREDVVHAIYHLLRRDDLEGPFNLTAPNPVTLQTFAHTLGRVLERPTWLRIPAPIVRTAYGEVAEQTVLLSTRAIPERLEASDYRFLHAELEDALRHLLGRTDRMEMAGAEAPVEVRSRRVRQTVRAESAADDAARSRAWRAAD